ncbi:MAG TPA: tripartite tricarboxylate transporter substrate binding protein [Burkholderiales bacterium]|nr:tripartite tricarboxylate transporter substrate binding protein [Burkholderiales bacterium]
MIATVMASTAAPGLAQSTQDFPTRPVRIIVPLTAGSAADLLARRLAVKMSENWGQQVVVDNRPGAGTTLGTSIVAKATPDGYTLLVNSAAFAVSAALYSKLPYDSLKDFSPVSQIAIAPIILVAAPSLGAKSVKDLVALARQKPGQITYGSSGVGSSTHFAGEQFKIAAGIEVVHVPYKGPPEALLDTMTGRIQYLLAPLVPALPFIKDRRLLALAVTTAQRTPVLPDVPTVAEAALPGYEYQDWWGAFAPAGMSKPVIDKISKEIARIVNLPDIKKQMLNQGEEATPSTPEEFTRFVRAKVETARKVVTLAGIRAE